MQAKLKSLVVRASLLLQRVWANGRVQLVFHTAWEAAVGVLIPALLASHSSQDVKSALFLAGTTGAAAARHLVVSWLLSRKVRG